MINFLFSVFLIGIIIACIQDLKRREVDNFVNFSLLIFGISYWIFYSVFMRQYGLFLSLGLVLAVVFLVENLFYYSKVFAGGDSKLLLGLTGLFVASSLLGSMINIGIYVLLLMLVGSVYGLIYGGVLFVFRFKKTKKVFISYLRKMKFILFILIGVLLFIAGYFQFLFFILGLMIILYPFLYAFAKSVEDCCMIKEVYSKDLTEGDWLNKSVKYKGKKIEPYWEGLTKEQVRFLRGYKNKVEIKQGIPFVPAFLFAFILYWLFKEFLVGVVVGLI